MAGSSEDARDLVQDAFFRAARRTRSIPVEESAAEAWMFRILVNLCRDRFRKTAVRRRLRHALERPVPAAPDPESAAVARVTVATALAELPAKRRAVVVLAELEGLPTRRIARLLGCSEVTVRGHLALARRQLRRLLTESPGPRATGGRT